MKSITHPGSYDRAVELMDLENAFSRSTSMPSGGN